MSQLATYGVVVGDTVHREAKNWADRVAANAGTLTNNSLRIASRFLWKRDKYTWRDKLLWLAPGLGNNLAAFRTPLIDKLGGGLMENVGAAFADADFSETRGITGNGTNKILNTNIYPIQLGRGTGVLNGGLGYMALAIDTTVGTTVVMGCSDGTASLRFQLDLRDTGAIEFFPWGSPGNGANSGVAAAANHYYGQRNALNSRKLYRNGSLVATNTTNDTPSSMEGAKIHLMGQLQVSPSSYFYNKGRCGFAYLTNGELTEDEIASMHGVMIQYLKEASAKV